MCYYTQKMTACVYTEALNHFINGCCSTLLLVGLKKKATVKFLSCFSKLGTRLPKANASVLAEQGKGRRDAAL